MITRFLRSGSLRALANTCLLSLKRRMCSRVPFYPSPSSRRNRFSGLPGLNVSQTQPRLRFVFVVIGTQPRLKGGF